MIGFISNGRYLQSRVDSHPHMYLNNNTGAGMLRFHPQNGIEVFDGNNWTFLPKPSIHLELSPAAESAIDWVVKKMEEEKKLQQLITSNQSVQIAYENFKKAEQQLQVAIHLSNV